MSATTQSERPSIQTSNQNEQTTSKIRDPQPSTTTNDIKTKGYPPVPRPLESGDNFEKKLEKEIFEWLQEIPVYANDKPEAKVKREVMIKNLADTLKKLTKDECFEEKVKEEVKKCIESLPMWSPGGNREQDIFKDHIAENLLNRIKEINKEKDFEKPISDWVNEIPFIDTNIDKRKIISDFTTKLKPVIDHKPSDINDLKNKIKEEIFDFLADLAILFNGNKNEVINQLIENLSNRLQDLHDVSSTAKSHFEILVLEWLRDIPCLDGKYSKILADELMKIVSELEAQGKSEDIIQEELQNVIIRWLDKNIRCRNCRLDPSFKQEVDNKLVNMLVPSRKTSKGQDLEEYIWNWFKEIPELFGGNETENRKLTHKLKNKLQELCLKNKENDKEMRDEILDWLQNTCQIKNKFLNSRTQENLADKLLNIIKNTETDNKLIADILGWIETQPDFKRRISSEKQILAEKLVRRIKEIQCSEDDDSAQNKIYDEILNWLIELQSSHGNEINLSNLEKSAKKLLAIINPIKTRKRWSPQEHDLQESILEDRREIIEESPIKVTINRKNEFTHGIANTFAKNVNKIHSDRRNEVYEDILQDDLTKDANMSKMEAQKLSKKLGDKVRDFSPLAENNPETSNEKPSIPQTLNQNTVTKKCIREEVVDVLDKSEMDDENRSELEADIRDFIADQLMRGEGTFKIENHIRGILRKQNLPGDKIETLTKKLMGVCEGLSLSSKSRDSASLYAGKRDSLRKATISGHVEDVDNMETKDAELWSTTKRKRFKQGKNLDYRVQKQKAKTRTRKDPFGKSPFKSSSPRTSSTEKKITFFPSKDMDSPVSSIDSYNDDDDTLSETKSNRHPDETSEEEAYINNLLNIVKGWIEELSIDLNAADKEGFKTTMIKDLANDIIDRQKYLQLNPSAKTSESEELEHLKYQVFKWLNKLLHFKDFSSSMPKTKILMNRLKQVPVPQLVTMRGKQKKRNSEGSPHCDLIQDSSQFVEENLAGGISDCLKFSPILRKGMKLDAVTQEQIVSGIVREIINIIRTADSNTTDVSFDNVFLDKISKYLKGLPVDLGPESEYQKTAGQLLNHIKGLQLFQNISARHPQAVRTDNDWISTLPLSTRKTTKEKQAFLLNQEPQANETIQIFFNISSSDSSKNKTTQRQGFQTPQMSIKMAHEALIDSISNSIKTLPIFRDALTEDMSDSIEDFATNICDLLTDGFTIANHKPQFEKVITAFIERIQDHLGQYNNHELSEQLLKIIINVCNEQKSQDFNKADSTFKGSTKKATDVLYDNVAAWCENLPISGDNSEEIRILKQNLVCKLMNKIGELNMNPEVFNDDFLYDELLQDEIDNLLDSLPNQLENILPELKQKLIDLIKEAKNKINDELEGSFYKQQLRDTICKTLPIPDNLSFEGQASFEALKDSVADAFVNLHYESGNEFMKNQYRNEINSKINEFCYNYLRRSPCTPLDTVKINRDLYNALQQIPKPKNETLKYEVEQARIRNVINSWLSDVIVKNETSIEKLQRMKMVSVLAKRLQELEKDPLPNAKYNGTMQKEIIKFLKKIPLRHGDTDLIKIAQELLTKLKNRENLQKISRCCCVPPEQRLTRQCPAAYISRYSSAFPPSTLSNEDRAHLQRIRDRIPMPEVSVTTPRCNLSCTDASVSPQPVDIGSQTEIGPSFCSFGEVNNCCPKFAGSQTSNNEMSRGIPTLQSIQKEISPHVIVREYYWDSSISPVCSTLPQSFISTVPFSSPQPSFPQGTEEACLAQRRTAPYHQQNFGIGGNNTEANPSCSFFQNQSPNMSSHSQYPLSQTRVCKDNTNILNAEANAASHDSIPQYEFHNSTTPKKDCNKSPKTSHHKCSGGKSPELSGESSRTDEGPTSTGKCHCGKAKVTRLGSLDHIQTEPKNFRNANPGKSKERIGDEDFEWDSHFPDDSDFWESCCKRQHGLPANEYLNEPYTRERKQERIKCRCRERIVTSKAKRPRCKYQQSYQSCSQHFKPCNKCQGIHCPFPSYLYFR